jgi:hypothetical protein
VNSLKIALLLLAGTAMVTAGSAKSTFHGEISDTQCAMNVHSLSRSHEEMITKKTMGSDPASCARACVRRGGEWVLRSGEEVYRLKNQTGIEEFSSQNVKVVGTLDFKTKTIDNASIDVLPSTKPAGRHP